MAEEQPKELTVTIDGKTYKESELPKKAIGYINLRSEVVNNRARYVAEIEKCDVILNYYVDQIKKAIDESQNTEEEKEKTE